MFKDKGVDAELIDEIFLGDGKKDHWFSAQEAEEIGLIDKVKESSIEQKAAASSRNMISDFYKYTNQKREVVMFNSKEELKQVKSDIVDLLKNINSFVTKEDVLNLTKEENDKIAETINTENQEKFDEMKEKNENLVDLLNEIKDSTEKIMESIADLEKSNTENAEKLTELEQKIDSTIASIKNVVTDFEVPEAVDSLTKPDQPVSKAVYNKQLSDEINEINEKRSK
jgi:methyl-accepting chemotaxis protein